MTGRATLAAALALAISLTACGPQDWCKGEAKAHAIATQVLPVLLPLIPAEAGPLSDALATAHAGVLAVGCDGDKQTLGERVAAVAEIVGRVLALYQQFRPRDIGGGLSQAEIAKAQSDLAKLQESIARERAK